MPEAYRQNKLPSRRVLFALMWALRFRAVEDRWRSAGARLGPKRNSPANQLAQPFF